jgi:hypothetical protein
VITVSAPAPVAEHGLVQREFGAVKRENGRSAKIAGVDRSALRTANEQAIP